VPSTKFGTEKVHTAGFRTTFDFVDRRDENLKLRYQLQPLPYWAKISGELWSTNKKVIRVNVNPLKWTFQEITLRPLGGAGLSAPQIITHARHSPSPASAYHKPGRGHQKNLKGEHLKFGLNFSVFAPITLGAVGVSSRNFTRRRVVRKS